MFKKSLQSLFCILPQSAFYSQSAVCILPLVRSLQSAVRSLRFTLTDKKTAQKGPGGEGVLPYMGYIVCAAE